VPADALAPEALCTALADGTALGGADDDKVKRASVALGERDALPPSDAVAPTDALARE